MFDFCLAAPDVLKISAAMPQKGGKNYEDYVRGISFYLCHDACPALAADLPDYSAEEHIEFENGEMVGKVYHSDRSKERKWRRKAPI